MTRSVRDLLQAHPGVPPALLSTNATHGVKSRKAAAKQVAAVAPLLAGLQEQLFAMGKEGAPARLLLVLQSMDAGGKDGAVKHVVGLVNPAGTRVTSFVAPTEQEREHDFLWRIERRLPPPGQIGVFNRSHYEDVLIVRVHDLVPREQWEARYDRINEWESGLVEQGFVLLKVFLHVSRDEQKKRLLARFDDPTKHWKVGAADLGERAHWDDYQEAYDAVLHRCAAAAPWYVVPADHKWYRDWALSSLLVETLQDMGLHWPEPAGLDLVAMRAELLTGP